MQVDKFSVRNFFSEHKTLLFVQRKSFPSYITDILVRSVFFFSEIVSGNRLQ